ncbi:endonuclease/exonuclease/phosphatase family protein [Salsipaludibacter albus]|uniref:endonuclease/exonuclease/phosphatase family protein n=1 Tax=Salsipaludibacter albus TaxID=2849650 RepID=UPI001EE4DA90|nr:endonuclease/exonuclease/phosphatase family protein [Salsipaludibacter albus]MBY5163268.1 endonuclease/exonuclease/phosphatase family protein [Salsipaludibacter albus]
MRIVSWNIEWMNDWFVGGGAVAWRDRHTGIADVHALADRVAGVVADLEADVVAIQEGPSDRREMQLFLDDHLAPVTGTGWHQVGGLDGGAQKPYLLARDGGPFGVPMLAVDPATQALFEPWLVDVDGDLALADYQFTRDPLVVDGGDGHGGETRLVVVHAKSKFVNQARALWEDPARRPIFISAAVTNRRRISAEAIRLRDYLDEIFDTDPDHQVVVAGDLNDGPGFDYFERHYLTHGVADLVLGSVFRSETQYRHAVVDRYPADLAWTAIFDDFVDEIPDRRVLLDHVMVSPSLVARLGDAGIAHDAWEAAIDPSRPVEDRDHVASDHRPVVADLA